MDDDSLRICQDPSVPHIYKPRYRVYCTLPCKTAVTCIEFSEAGNYLAVSYINGLINIYNPQNGILLKVLQGHNERINDIAFSHETESLMLASVSIDETVRLWDFRKGKFLKHLSQPQRRIYSTCCFDYRSDTLLASSMAVGYVTLFNVLTGYVMHEITLYNTLGISCLVSSTSFYILSSSLSGKCLLWSMMTAKPSDKVIYRICCPVVSCALTSDGKYYLESLLNNQIHLRETKNVNNIKIFCGHTCRAIGVDATFSEGGSRKLIVSGSEDGLVYVWDMETTRIIQKLKAHKAAVIKVACHPCDTIIASASKDNTVKLWTSLV